MPSPLHNIEMYVSSILANQSVITRCGDLTHLISTVSVQELRPHFQTIVDSIFGFTNYIGWGLRSTSRQSLPRETETISRFLAPNGPLIELTYRLMADPSLKYEFPVKCLPISIERQIYRGELIPFLANKLPAVYASSPMPKAIVLNAFEYYFCMFAFLQLNSSAENSSYLIGWGNMTDSVYTNLLEDYLAYFLPCNGHGVPNVEFNFRQIADNNFITGRPPPRSPCTITAGQLDNTRPKLFKPLVFQDQLVGTTQREQLFHSAIPAVQKEIWRTETILNIFILFWMSVDVQLDSSSLQYETVLPSVDLVKSVRVMVRHFHYFVNTMGSHLLHPLDDIRRSTFPVFQKKLYTLLRYLLARWPLDNSFRIVYETWLSYIQPWRYVNDRIPRNFRRDRDRDEMQIDSRWYNFVLENILFYTYLFHLMMPRFERVDLVAARNAHMLFRVTKVFSQSDSLKNMLKEAERTLQTDSTRPQSTGSDSFFHSTPSSNNLIYLHSPSKSSSSLTRSPSNMSGFFSDNPTTGITVAQVQHHLRELENPNFVYQPLFSNANRDKIMNLNKLICEARRNLADLITQSEDQNRVPLSWYERWFGTNSGSSDPYQSKQSLLQERNKAFGFLEQSRNNLARVFDLTFTDPTETQFEGPDGEMYDYTEQGSYGSFSSVFQRTASEGGLSPDQQPIYPPGKFNPETIKPLGNPDLAPLKGDEQSYIVPFLISFSQCLNRIFLPVIQGLYFEDDWRGRLTRAIVAKPLYYDQQVKHGPGRVLRIKKYLPPRINLRFLGSNYFDLIVLGMFLLGLFLGVHGLGWIFCPLFSFLIYAGLRASTEPQDYLFNLRREFAPSIDLAYVLPPYEDPAEPPYNYSDYPDHEGDGTYQE